MAFTLLMQNLSCHCSSHRTSKLSFFYLVAGWVGYQFDGMSLLHDVFTTSLYVAGMLSLPLSWYRSRVLSQEMASATTFFLPRCVWTGCQTAVVPRPNGQALGWAYQWWRMEQVVCGCNTLCTMCLLYKMKTFELTDRLHNTPFR